MDKYGLPAVYNTLMSGIGEELGTGEVRYIQDVGQKVEGTPYLDKNTNKLYLCVQTTSSVNNDSSFMRFDMKEAFAKLQNLTENLPKINGGVSQFEIKNGSGMNTGDSTIGENLITFETPFKIECLAVIPFDNDGNPILFQQVRYKSKEGFKVRSYHITDGKEYTGRNDNFNYVAFGR